MTSTAQDTAWLDDARALVPEKPADEFAWLDDGTDGVKRRLRKAQDAQAPARAPRASKKMTEDKRRFQSMARGAVMGKDRVWACDGEYVAVRLNAANPATRERHQKFLESGHYEHVETQDDVQVFRLLKGSPFKRHYQFHTGELRDNDLFLMTAKVACTRDWVAYADLLEEAAARIKGRCDAGTAKVAWDEWLQRLFINIAQRGGPTQSEVDAGLQRIRLQRGVGKGKVIALPRSAR